MSQDDGVDGRENLVGLTPAELAARADTWGQPPYRGRQLAGWIYGKGVLDFAAMSDLPRPFRERLLASAVARIPEVAERLPSQDGSEKLVLRLHDGRAVQSVVMPDGDRLTLCLSSQVGCGYGCKFCLTGTMGLVRDLSAAEIVGQVLAARGGLAAGARLTHVVFMGMGEPLANYGPTVSAIRILTDPHGFGFSSRRVTLSTVGLVQGLTRLARDDVKVNLAISLHAATDDTRSRLMPVNRGVGLDELLAACRRFPLPFRQRITFEYTLLHGVNDAPADARQLVRCLAGLRAKVNLIPFNEWEGAGFERPPLPRIEAFQRVLLDAGLTATVRWSKGEDVGAACGQLRTADRREGRGPRPTPGAPTPLPLVQPAGA
jgi:23S rRNA (adenine2503-C2)-methyltransferase